MWCVQVNHRLAARFDSESMMDLLTCSARLNVMRAFEIGRSALVMAAHA